MSKKEMHSLVQAICYGLMASAIGLCTPAFTAEEAKETKSSTDSPCKSCQVRVEVHGKIPLLEKLPFVNRLFKTAKIEEEVANGEKEPFERIGVDFDILPGHMVSFGPFGECQAVCTEYGCTFCPNTACASDSKVACNHECCKAAAKVVCNHECCKAAGCKTCSATQEVTTKLELPRENECQQVCNESHVVEQLAACERITELQVQNAAMQSAIDAHEALAEAKDGIFEMMLELSAENAKLQAQVEFLNERGGLQEKLLESLAENAKLKATIELTEERHAMLKQSLVVSAENERLKLRVAELEQHGQSAAKATKTAKKAQTKKGTVVK